MAISDLREGVAVLHGDPDRGAGPGSGPAAGCRRHGQGLAGFDVIGVAEAVELHQLVDAQAVALSDLREGFPLLHGHLTGPDRQGQHQGQGQGDERATHGRYGWESGGTIRSNPAGIQSSCSILSSDRAWLVHPRRRWIRPSLPA